jgi:hypothetical protein
VGSVFKKKNLGRIFATWNISFGIKIIKLATSRPRHFQVRHLYQHFCKNAAAHQGESPFNAY